MLTSREKQRMLSLRSDVEGGLPGETHVPDAMDVFHGLCDSYLAVQFPKSELQTVWNFDTNKMIVEGRLHLEDLADYGEIHGNKRAWQDAGLLDEFTRFGEFSGVDIVKEFGDSIANCVGVGGDRWCLYEYAIDRLSNLAYDAIGGALKAFGKLFEVL